MLLLRPTNYLTTWSYINTMSIVTRNWRRLEFAAYFAGQGVWLQMRLFASGRGIPSQKFGVTRPPCSSMQDASDICANRWHVLRIKAVALGTRVRM